MAEALMIVAVGPTLAWAHVEPMGTQVSVSPSPTPSPSNTRVFGTSATTTDVEPWLTAPTPRSSFTSMVIPLYKVTGSVPKA